MKPGGARELGAVPPPGGSALGLDTSAAGLPAHVANALDVAFHRPSTVTGKALGVLHRDIKPGNVFRCTDGRVKLMDFGAFVNFLGSKDGLVHISELAQERVGEVGDVVSLGDEVKVKVIGLDDRGKVKLSMRAVNQETGEEIPGEPRPPRGDRGDRPRRGRGRAGGDD